jgi:hypothetical protein
MTALEKKLLIAAFAVASLIAGYQAFVAAGLKRQNAALAEKQTAMTDEMQRLQRERDEANKESAAAHSSTSVEVDRNNELLRLRGEVARLRAELNQRGRSAGQAAGEEPDSRSPLGRISLLKRALKEKPALAIPEMQLLKDADWLRMTQVGALAHRDLETEDGLRAALSVVRRDAKTKFAARLETAVASYAAANGDQLPANMAQLKPYLDAQMEPFDPQSARWGGSPGERQNYPPVDDAVVARYQMIQGGSTSNLRPGQPVMAEVAPVDQEFDTLFQIGLKSFFSSGTGKDQSTGWGGAEAPDVQSMTPEQRTAYENAIQRQAAAKQSQPR